MSISRVHTWSSGEILLASDLNAEFNSIIGNGSDLVSPFTKAISMGGFAFNLDAANTIALTATTSGVVLTGGTLREPTQDTVTAFATGGQANATALTAATKYHRISVCATAGDSYKLPTSTAGQCHYVRNDGAAAAQAFGSGTDTINGVATATGIPHPVGIGIWFVCTTAGNWTTGALVTVSGNFPVTLTATAATGVTLPTTGTLATLAGSEALSNKTISSSTVGNTNTITLKDTLFTLQDDGDATKQAQFQLSGITASKTRTITLPNEDFTMGVLARGHISGFTYSNNGADSIDIAAGAATDSTNAYSMSGSALTKSIASTWAVGNAQGMLDAGSVGNSDYYLWVIARSDTGVVDYLASLSSTAPTMPANYDFKRLIGWFKRTGGSNVAFTTKEIEGGGIELLWTTVTQDINLSNTLTTARRTDAVRVPLNFSVTALLSVVIADPTASDAIIYCPDQADISPATISNITNAAGISGSASMNIRTSSTGTIAARASTATMDVYNVSTMGFKWARKN